MGKITAQISRILIGMLFVFSGYVKCVDPVGSAIKFEEYFIAFGMDWLVGGAVFLAVLMSAMELILGCTMIFGLYNRISAWIALCFISFFTLLTVVIYFTNPVEDCGCFGDAVKLSNGATLLKNIVTLIVFIPFFRSVKKLEWINNDAGRFTRFMAIVAAASFIPIYAINYLPFVDFLPYKIGVNIPQAMATPEDAKQDEYETTLIYKSIENGVEREFAVEDTTWYDQTKWEYVDTKTKLIKKGYSPEIASFNIFDKDKNDVTDRILSEGISVALFIINNKNISPEILTNIQKSVDTFKKNNITPVFVTRFEIDWLSNVLCSVENCTVYEVYNADETLLKSVIRAPFGVMVLRDGTILSKHNLNNQVIFKQR